MLLGTANCCTQTQPLVEAIPGIEYLAPECHVCSVTDSSEIRQREPIVCAGVDLTSLLTGMKVLLKSYRGRVRWGNEARNRHHVGIRKFFYEIAEPIRVRHSIVVNEGYNLSF